MSLDWVLSDVSASDAAHTSFSWRTAPKKFEDLIQVTDGYVVHARGYTVDDEVWLDEYNVNSEHKVWWDRKMRTEYTCDWSASRVLYWSVTGAETFLMQYPRIPEATDEQVARLAHFLDWWDVPGETSITWAVNEQQVESGRVSQFLEIV